MFVFASLWVIFRFFNYCGIFPCYKKCIEGEDHLKPTKTVFLLLKYLIFFGLFIVSPIAVALIYNVTWDDLMKGTQGTQISKIVMGMIFVFFIMEHFISTFALWKIKQDLCNLQDFVNSRLALTLPPEDIAYKIGFFLFLFLSFLSTFLFPFGLARGLADFLNYNTVGFITTYALFIIFYIGLLSPVILIVFLLAETLKFVHRWLRKLQNMVNDPCESNMKVLSEIEKFCNEWNNIRSFVSFPLFESFLFSIAQVIVVVYVSLSFFIDTQTVDNGNMTMQVIGFMTLGTGMTFAFVFTCFYGEKIGSQVKDLKEILQDQYIIDLGQSDEVLVMKKLVVCHLCRWENFDGYGFFTLGKPFLTGLFANFITYIIILIQFQLSE